MRKRTSRRSRAARRLEERREGGLVAAFGALEQGSFGRVLVGHAVS